MATTHAFDAGSTRRRKGAPFEESVDYSGDCHLWMAARTRNGYGNYHSSGRNWVAHRFAWEQANGPIPDSYELHHTCHVRNCVNLDHLQMVTRAEHRRIEGELVTHCPAGHEYTPENTYLRAYNGRRQCRTCHREQERKRRARNG